MLQCPRRSPNAIRPRAAVITLDKITGANGKPTYRVADPDEVVPRGNQFLVPEPTRKGHNWDHFVEGLPAMGYKVEWRVICNAKVGCRSRRTRLYIIARCDGLPIVWPELTHAKNPTGKLKPYKQAAECINWSIPGTSIFGHQKELAKAHPTTLCNHSIGRDTRDPVPVVSAGGEHHAQVRYELGKEDEAGAPRCAALLMRYHASGGHWADPHDAMTTITTHGRLALVTAWLKGEPWVIVEMLTPRELYNVQHSPLAYQINHAAAKLDVSRATIYLPVKDKHLKLVKVGKRASRITAQSIHDYLESRCSDNAG